jgi:hypothetical protein
MLRWKPKRAIRSRHMDVPAAGGGRAESKNHTFCSEPRREGMEPESPNKMIHSRWRANGAGDGNRTHVSSLGSYSSTIELHPRAGVILFIGWCMRQLSAAVLKHRGCRAI